MNRLVRRARRDHNRYVRQAIREREGYDPHGLYTFCCTVLIITLLLIGAGLLWVVNR